MLKPTAIVGQVILYGAFAAFIGVVIWAFGRKRKARFEKDARIPFEDGKD